MRRTGLAIVGTDTGVGKTCVAAGLVLALRRRGVDVAPWKPYASGVDPERLTPGEDADLLLRAAGWAAERLPDVSPIRLAEPLAPSVAAARAGAAAFPYMPPDALALDDEFGPPAADVLVVEGCGGLLAPLAPGRDLRDLCRELALPVLVVARPGLGTLNHTALTVESARSAGLDVLGIVISGFDEATAGVAERTNVGEIARIAGAPLLGVVPRVTAPDDVAALADAVAGAVDLDGLLADVRRIADPDRARRLADLDHRHVWHPFTQMQDWAASEPVVIERAEGAWLIDVEGRRYLDGVSSLWTNVHGHRVPEIDAAVRAQLARVAHTTLLGLASVPSIECAAALLDVAPRNLTRVFWSDSGSTAVEVALKMAFQRATQIGEASRRLFIRFEGAYHGDTLGAVAVGGIDVFHHAFGPLLFPTIRIPVPYAYRRPEGMTETDVAEASVAQFEAVMHARGEEIAAVVVEPVMQGAAGMIPQPPGWLPRISAATRAAGALLVCDEVATGFGRTGRMFAVEHEGVEPDLMCVAKGLTGGYLPLAATLATERVFEAFLGEPHEGRTFFHGHTYTGNPLACAAAVASLRLMRERGTVAAAVRLGESLARWIDLWIAPHPNVGDVRRRGAMVGIELVRDRATKAPFDVRDRVAWRVCRAAMARGLRIRPLGDVLVLMPPLSLALDDTTRLVAMLRDALHDVLPCPRGRSTQPRDEPDRADEAGPPEHPGSARGSDGIEEQENP